MKKLSYLLITSVIFFFSILNNASAEGIEAPISIGPNLMIESQHLNATDDSSHTTIKTTYPQIIGQTLSSHAEKFNQLIQEKINTEIDHFKQFVSQDITFTRTLPKSVQKNNLLVDYDIDVIHPNHGTIIMVRLNIEGMQSGHAHPYHKHGVLNYDLDKGKVLALADLFKPNTNFLKKLSELSRQKLLATRQLPHNMVNEGTQADPNNFKTWNLQNDTLLITFDENQVGPYANGHQEVEIPYSEIKNMMAPNSVVSTCVVDPSSCEARA